MRILRAQYCSCFTKQLFLDLHAQAAAFYVNCANYTAELRGFFGPNDMLVPYLLVLLNVFSPHRFLAAPEELAAVTPIHARLLQCLRQYLEKNYGRCTLTLASQCPSSGSRSGAGEPLGPLQCPIRPYTVEIIEGESETESACGQRRPETGRYLLYGEPSAPLAALSAADRARFVELIDTSRISSRVLASRRQSSHSTSIAPYPQPQSPLNPSIKRSIDAGAPAANTNHQAFAESYSYTPAFGVTNVDWRWLFDFCVAALNDVRVDEVSQRDYEMRLAISSKFSPLIVELLDPLSSHFSIQTLSASSSQNVQ